VRRTSSHPARRRRFAAVLLAGVTASAATAAAVTASDRRLCAAAAEGAAESRLAVLSAFPAELAPLVAAAEIETTVEADGRRYHLARLEGVRVVLGLAGIGMVNAATTTASVIRSFAPAGIIVSGVAGSRYRIGDVVVAAQWVEESGGRVFRANPALVELARRASEALPAQLQRCTRVPPTSPDGATVCLPYDPLVIFGHRGQTGDPFGGKPFPCIPGGGEVLDCQLPGAPAPSARVTAGPPVTTDQEVQDMETAAVARVAARHRVPFLAVRAVSDGAGDPLGDRGFPAQFFDYYRLAAENASLVTRAFLARLSSLAGDPSARRICRLLAHRRWRRAAARLRAEARGRMDGVEPAPRAGLIR